MNYTRILLAAFGGWLAYFALGGFLFSVLPSLRNEFLKFPAVYRSKEGQMSHLPGGMVAMFLSMVVLAALYALFYRGGSGVVEGARFGALIGAFAICAFVVHNYVNLNIGLTLALQQSAAYFLEWLVTGIVIGLLYRPGR
jgi:hypothetical protein